MITSWILNFISNDLIDGFIYTVSSRDLWFEIIERFGESMALKYMSCIDIFLLSLKKIPLFLFTSPV